MGRKKHTNGGGAPAAVSAARLPLTELAMATYTFSLSKSEDARQAGIIQSASFEEALRLVGARMPVTQGDLLEIGVKGFPPARYQCAEALLDGTVFWQPARMAA